MTKKLTAIGNSLGIVIEKPILDLLNIDRETRIEMTTDGNRLILSPVRTARRARLDASAKNLMDRHARVFSELAK